MPAWEIRRLDRQHDRSQFDCGQPVLNDWLRSKAGQWDRKDLSKTFVATRPNESVVVGYYALSSHRIVYDDLPVPDSKGLPKLDVPVVLLGRLAVDRSVQGCGLGSHLLIDALRRVTSIADEIGVRAVEVDAIDDAAREFYLKYGFRLLRDDRRHLFMPMHEIRKLKLES
jgi:GNAT superfamily N-acetyltransferase